MSTDAKTSPIFLTDREKEVLNAVAEGLSSQEIAIELYVSKRTVDFHLANIYTKLTVNNRIKALKAAQKLGLL